ncbi:MAG: hypothetical protein QOK17_2675 [Sphingomonadales bacterium]|jgi:integrase|nr:hypothetical protein [Sphingomonadales bacterium]
MADESISLMDGRLHLYRRANSRYWQCSTYLVGRNFRVSTKQDSIALAKEFAIEWYMEVYAAAKRRERGESVPPPSHLRGGHPDIIDRRRRPVASGPSFKEAADAFIKEFVVSVQGQRNEHYVTQKQAKIDVHLLPFFGKMTIAEVTAGTIQDYRVHRQTSRKDKHGQPLRPARGTLHQEIVTLRQILKTACRKGWIAALPDMTAPYKSSGKIRHRGWFSPAEYTTLYEATRERAENPKKERWRAECALLHDYVLIMGNTGLRPDEASRLEFRDVSIVTDHDTGERILEIEVRGKRGVGYCKSMPGAVFPFERLVKRRTAANGGQAPAPTELIFGKVQRELLNSILKELGLKKDRDGNVRTAYSLRHTYICMRLMEGADIYQVAKNCRTSVEMIETFYASHIKNTLDASQINVRKPKRPAQGEAAPAEAPPSP